ncbi:glycine--tRNA ligase subunit beta, partial [Burkholderia sp. SIMBA_051]|uniref:glycine--tRNA ligase subunit beta n=1 Tax=Burkholderia sp. SIMBA_051 TaxID=3085792 RepID=UPI00397915B2
DTTRGHRFLSEGPIAITQADDYAHTLQHKGRVIASYSERRESIRAQLVETAGDDKVVMPDSLLDDVNSLVEWPVVYACQFEEEFLQVP